MISLHVHEAAVASTTDDGTADETPDPDLIHFDKQLKKELKGKMKSTMRDLADRPYSSE